MSPSAAEDAIIWIRTRTCADQLDKIVQGPKQITIYWMNHKSHASRVFFYTLKRHDACQTAKQRGEIELFNFVNDNRSRGIGGKFR